MVAEFKTLKKLIILGKLAPTCALCGKPITKGNDLSQGHILAKSKGGKTVPENLVPCHKKCNSEMGTLDLKEWYLLWNYRQGKDLSGYNK